LYYCFAPDEFHKANYNGGENYHVWLPDPNADFRIIGMYEIDENFVSYVRATLAHGGFRGKVERGTVPRRRVSTRPNAPFVTMCRA
jgi:hypothetical protein